MLHALRRIVSIGVLCASVLSLAACGITSDPSGAAQVPTSAHTPTSSSATHTPTSSGATDCGQISASGALQGSGGDPSTVETCFATAYAHCTPATLVYTQFGVDAGVIHTLRIARGVGDCLVTDDAQRYSVVTRRGTSEPTVHFTCAAVESFDGGIRIRQCGAEGDVVIPSGA